MTETTEENIKPRAGALGSTIEENMLPKIKSRVKKQAALITQLEAQVSSLTKERDELKHDLGGEIYALQNENNVLKAQVEDLNYRAEEDERTIISHEKEMDALKSQLSNREKEIEELKKKNESLENALKVTPGVITEEDLEWARNSLASLNKEREE
tara:strand:- start:1595 stop:2062 length:468 start_codon:yes stop_codon:yes gene_type:complete